MAPNYRFVMTGQTCEHGEVAVYVKETFYYRRKDYLKLHNVECVWDKILIKKQKKKKTKKKLYLRGRSIGHQSLMDQSFFDVEMSIGLAYDTGIKKLS